MTFVLHGPFFIMNSTWEGEWGDGRTQMYVEVVVKAKRGGG